MNRPIRSCTMTGREALDLAIDNDMHPDSQCWGTARAELARLRRMADAYAKGQLIQHGLCCFECNTGNGKHTATCDVAIHRDLPREKGEGE